MASLMSRRVGSALVCALVILMGGTAAMAVSVSLDPASQEVWVSSVCEVGLYIADLVSPGMEAL